MELVSTEFVEVIDLQSEDFCSAQNRLACQGPCLGNHSDRPQLFLFGVWDKRAKDNLVNLTSLKDVTVV